MHAYRYYRWWITAVQGAGNVPGIAEAEIMTTVGGADTSAGLTYTATTTFSTDVAANAFDDNTSTQWGGSVNTLPQELRVDYGATAGNWIAANQITMTARTAGAEAQMFKDFIFQGSDDASVWTDLITRSGVVWAAGEKKTFTFP